ncbi:hypothetical protein SLE2022_097130 [Rubroshorea leprosula]
MEKSNISQPISTILNGSNYILWAQNKKYVDCLEDWDSKNHQIITWFRNTSIPSIHLQFGRYETAKEVWDLLAARYTTSDLSSQYQLWEELHNLKQECGESITSFYAKMEAIWDQLALSEPTFNDTVDIGKYIEYRDKMSLVECRKCKQKGHITPNCATSLPQRSDQWKTQSKPDQSSKPMVVAAAANEDTSVHPSIGNLETLLRQMISSSFTSIALPTILGSIDGTDSWDRP